MRRLAFLIALLSPLPAAAADGQPTLMGSLVQTAGALAVVVGLIILISRFSERWSRGGGTPGRLPRYIRVIETRCLAPKKALILVEVGGEYLLLGSSGDGVSFLKQVDLIEEIEVVEERRLPSLAAPALLDAVKGVFTRLPGAAGQGFSLGKSGAGS